MRKTTYNSTAGTGLIADVKYAYDGFNLWAEYDAANGNAVVRTYTWGLDAGGGIGGSGTGGLLMISVGTDRWFPAYDARHNLTGLLDQNGAWVAAYTYDAFGRITAQQGAAAAVNPIGFATQYTDRETGLLYFGQRFYSPKLGRFVNRDPIEEAGGLNLYAYCGNGPASQWDHLGLDGEGGSDNAALALLRSLGKFGRSVVDFFFGGGGDRPADFPVDEFGFDPWDDSWDDPTWGFDDDGSYTPDNSYRSPDGTIAYEALVDPAARLSFLERSVAANSEAASDDPNHMKDRRVYRGDRDPSQRISISMGYTDAGFGKYHTFVIITNLETGEQLITRASATNKEGAAVVAEFASQIANGTMPVNDRSKTIFGPIKAETGNYGEQSPFDRPSQTLTVRPVGTMSISYEEAVQHAQDFADQVNKAEIPYYPFGQNSNSYAFTFVESLGFPRPDPAFPETPAAGKDLRPFLKQPEPQPQAQP